MRNPARIINKWRKHLYSAFTPLIRIDYRCGIIGGVENDFGAIVDGQECRDDTMEKKCHVVPLAEASRTISSLGEFNVNAMMFHFDRQDSEIQFENWDDIILHFQGEKYWVDPIKIEKVKSLLVPLGETSMATIIIAELKR